MLDERERHEIDRELAKYPDRQAAAPEALMIVQRHRGWVSDETLADVAGYLGMTPAELDGLATAYNLIFREPVGRHVLFMCDSISCWLAGQAALYDRLRERLGIGFGETTADGRFTLLPIACAGACDEAPVILVDETLYVRLDASKLDAILEKYE